MKTLKILSLAVLSVLAFSCKKDDPKPFLKTLSVEVSHVLGGQEFSLNEMTYQNQAGNIFSVSRLQYYISGVTLENEAGEKTAVGTAFLIDGEDQETWSFLLGPVPNEPYVAVEFAIGLVPGLNEHGKLPNTLEHNSMIWPEQMGGGYHFLKLEGHFTDAEGGTSGYAMHLGTNSTLVNIRLNDIGIEEEGSSVLKLKMDVMEWFQNPNTYDLNKGFYSMGNMELMHLIAENGKDAVLLQ